MALSQRPKVLIFDMGGVNSPFQAILEYELDNGIPPGWINHGISKSKPNGFWHRLERGEHEVNGAWFAGWEKDLSNISLWESFYEIASSKDPSLPKPTPQVPKINPETLFWSIIEISQTPDPWMYPALQSLQRSHRFMLIALSNTLPLPESQNKTFLDATSNLRSLFDIFISSAEIGLRKPDPKIYSYAMDAANAFAKKCAGSSRWRELGWKDEIKPAEVLFLDDIGENLKGGRLAGFGTIKVKLGKAFEAVDELEELTGLKLAGNHPRQPILLRGEKATSKL